MDWFCRVYIENKMARNLPFCHSLRKQESMFFVIVLDSRLRRDFMAADNFTCKADIVKYTSEGVRHVRDNGSTWPACCKIKYGGYVSRLFWESIICGSE